MKKKMHLWLSRKSFAVSLATTGPESCPPADLRILGVGTLSATEELNPQAILVMARPDKLISGSDTICTEHDTPMNIED